MLTNRRRAMRAPRALHATVGAVLLVCGAGCGDDGTSPVIEPPPSAAYDLVVVGQPRGFAELFVVSLAGGATAPLFPGEVNARFPAPSPDGRRIAYTSMVDVAIWVVDLVTGARQQLSHPEHEVDLAPAWSPDGTRLAFVSFRTEGSDIHLVNADGSGRRNLTPGDGPTPTFEDSPAWSPDGSRIAFSSDRDGGRSLYTIRPDGSDLQRLTHNPHVRDHEPSWSPDGTRLVFRRERTDAVPIATDLAVMGAGGGNLVEFRQPGQERSPAWSPDGAWIAYASTGTETGYRIYTIRPDGSEVVERAGGAAFGWWALHPRWMRRR